jgi:hypothetical protein
MNDVQHAAVGRHGGSGLEGFGYQFRDPRVV